MPYDATLYQSEKAAGRRGPTGALRLKKLTGAHLRIINLHLAGMKGGDIALQMGRTPAWVSTVLNDPLVKAEIQQRFVDTDNEMFARSTAVIDAAMSDPDPGIKLRAAELVWKARGKFNKPEDHRPTAEDVVARMLEIAAKTGEASVTVRTGPAEPPALPVVIEE